MADSQFTSAELLGLAGKADARTKGMPSAGLGQKVDFSAVVAYNATDLPLDCHVMLTATQACFIRLATAGSGEDAAANVDMYLLPSLPYMIRMGKNSTNVAYRRISVIRSTADGILYIMPMKAD